MSGGQEVPHKAVDIGELVRSMTQELDYYWSLGEGVDNGVRCCAIPKVQKHIRDIDRFSYEPFVLSIGPYHHGSTRLLFMDNMKWRYLDFVVKLNREKNMIDYLSAIYELANEARQCYSENIEMDNEEFLRMLVLDGCYVLVSMGGTNGVWACRQQEDSCSSHQQEVVIEKGEGSESVRQVPVPENVDFTGTDDMSAYQEDKGNDCTDDEQGDYCDDYIGKWFTRFLHHDLLLLENQIPMFIIRKLYDVLAGEKVIYPPFTDELANYIETTLRFYPKAIPDTERPKDFHHLLHLCHIYFRPSEKPEEHTYPNGQNYLRTFLSFGRKYLKLGHLPEDDGRNSVTNEADYHQSSQQLNRWRRATQFLEAGVKFKKREYNIEEPHSLLDVKFKNGAMEIPCLVIDEHTGTLFRNLIAFEQTCPQFGDDFTAYIVFLSQLISAPEDVTLLVRREILVHHLESDETVSDLFTLLSKDVVFDFNSQYYLRTLCHTMEAHYQSRLNRWMAWLWINHFRNPWLSMAAFATSVLLICTVVQTIAGILAYMEP